MRPARRPPHHRFAVFSLSDLSTAFPLHLLRHSCIWRCCCLRVLLSPAWHVTSRPSRLLASIRRHHRRPPCAFLFSPVFALPFLPLLPPSCLFVCALRFHHRADAVSRHSPRSPSAPYPFPLPHLSALSPLLGRRPALASLLCLAALSSHLPRARTRGPHSSCLGAIAACVCVRSCLSTNQTPLDSSHLCFVYVRRRPLSSAPPPPPGS